MQTDFTVCHRTSLKPLPLCGAVHSLAVALRPAVHRVAIWEDGASSWTWVGEGRDCQNELPTLPLRGRESLVEMGAMPCRAETRRVRESAFWLCISALVSLDLLGEETGFLFLSRLSTYIFFNEMNSTNSLPLTFRQAAPIRIFYRVKSALGPYLETKLTRLSSLH